MASITYHEKKYSTLLVEYILDKWEENNINYSLNNVMDALIRSPLTFHKDQCRDNYT